MVKTENDGLEPIRAYYDHNTPHFLSYGEQRKTRTIHRPVWGEAVRNEGQALHFVHNLILEELRAYQNGTSNHQEVLDMGCGVGASLLYLADHLGGNLSGIGLTISPVQAKIAQDEHRTKDIETRPLFLVGDFLAPPFQMQFDLIYSIEAFAHTQKPTEYFQAVGRLLKPGGRLVLCDDFLSGIGKGIVLSARKRQWLKIFQQGWGVNGL